MTRWHIITGEYPPQPGGVSDYTRLVARGLADAGDQVDVWAPPVGGDVRGVPGLSGIPGVNVHRLPDHFGVRAIRTLDRELDRLPAPRRLLVQYVPHAFGWKALNVPFCLWLRRRRHDSIWLMFHEVAFPIERGQNFRHRTLGLVTRAMAGLAAGAAERAFVSIPAWVPPVEALTGESTPVTWLPVPSSIAFVDDPRAAQAIRQRYGQGRPLVGHFGTYGDHIRPLLADAVPPMMAACDCRLLLLGRGSLDARAEIVSRNPELETRVHATGPQAGDEVSRHIAACDLMLQPYPDGVSSRRTSIMVALSHGRAVLTTAGALTEPLWADRGAVALVPAGESHALALAAVRLLNDPARLSTLGADARALYETRFDLSSTIATLRAADDEPAVFRAVS